jgi:serine/threonine protein kinase
MMEYMEGGELYEYLASHGPLDAAAGAELLFGLMSAVAHMHDRGIVHRDIKAENLMLVKKGSSAKLTVKLIDFGFSTMLMSQTNSFLGTAGECSNFNPSNHTA